MIVKEAVNKTPTNERQGKKGLNKTKTRRKLKTSDKQKDTINIRSWFDEMTS